MFKSGLLALVLTGLTVSAVSQEPATPASSISADGCSSTKMDSNGMTECQSLFTSALYLKLSNLHQSEVAANTAMNQAQQDEQKTRQDAQEFIKKVEAAHPGMMYEPPTQAFPIGRLVPKPAVAAPPAKSEAPKPEVKPKEAPKK